MNMPYLARRLIPDQELLTDACVSVCDATLCLAPPTLKSHWSTTPPWRPACAVEARVAHFWRACVTIPGARSDRRVSINSMAATEKLIQSVSGYPVLYNASLHDYRSSERRVNAWREVAACVGLSGQCVNITRARQAFDFEKCFCSVDLDDFTHIFTAGDSTTTTRPSHCGLIVDYWRRVLIRVASAINDGQYIEVNRDSFSARSWVSCYFINISAFCSAPSRCF